MTISKATLDRLPESSGVYQYISEDDKLLYIGKAKNIKRRVKNYFKFTPELAPSNRLNSRLFQMISQAKKIESIIVDNENDALILENSLIKQLKPKYNILLRDDKTYPYIYIDLNEKFPRFDITRKVINKKNIKYFGPFPSGSRDLLSSIYEIFPLVQKKSCLKGKKVCLYYQIKKCLGPCENKIEQKEYDIIVTDSMKLINNKNELLKILKYKMNKMSDELRFEEALELRDKITNIKKTEIKSVIDLSKDDNLDIFVTYSNIQKIVIVKMFVRNGKLVSSDYKFLRNSEYVDISDVYKMAMLNLYKNNTLLTPDEILISDEISYKEELSLFVSSKFNKKISIVVPKQGRKLSLVNIGLINCKKLLGELNKYDIKNDIKNSFNLSNYPHRIEIFDNSHMFGQSIVGGMVVYEDKFIKSDYRKFHLKERDEYSQSKEIFALRIERFYKNPPPDLWIIDGGKTLLDLAKSIITKIGANIDVISISKEKKNSLTNRSKGASKDILYFDNQMVKLSTSDKKLLFIQKLRDEAHRFAISFHRAVKLKEDKNISMINIENIGKAKIAKLINYFGTFKNIKDSTRLELQKVLNKSDADRIYEYFMNDK
jgi:excinuclease ABC subunit C